VEETKTTKTPAKTLQFRIELPQIDVRPHFEAQPLLLHCGRTGTFRLNLTPTLAIIHSLQLTMRDVDRFGEVLRDANDEKDIDSNKMLAMLDCRGSEMRALYREAADEFLGYLDTLVTDHYIPHAHLATVLLQVYEDRRAACGSHKRADSPPYYSQVEKAKIPALVIDATRHAAFIQDVRKSIIPIKKRTFGVAFPGFYMGRVLKNREKEMEACAK